LKRPAFDASETEDRIQKTGNRSKAKARRQNPAVDFASKARRDDPAHHGGETSESGSSAGQAKRAN
jgi:hypothetical protein